MVQKVNPQSAVISPNEIPDELNKVNLDGFLKDLESIREDAHKNLEEEDFNHLKRMERRGRMASFFGYLTAWIFPNPITVFLISLGQFNRWIVAHHVMHRGYDHVPGVEPRYTSKKFALGWRRYLDWFDWFLPEAWAHEHNYLHHYHTGQDHDPDLVERHLDLLRRLPIPMFFKSLLVLLAATTWKWAYYAPSTISTLEPRSNNRLKPEDIKFIAYYQIFDFRRAHVRRLWRQCYLPYGTVHFILIPLLFFPLGQTAVMFVFVNKVLAEMMTNLHGFLAIIPNHTADDLYRYEFHYDNKSEFYLTQVIGSVNYKCGGEIRDFMSGWLNYQIEHHLFPDLPMRKYQQIHPLVKEVCKKHNVPFVQESIFYRTKRMLDICIGRTSMKVLGELPETLRTS